MSSFDEGVAASAADVATQDCAAFNAQGCPPAAHPLPYVGKASLRERAVREYVLNA